MTDDIIDPPDPRLDGKVIKITRLGKGKKPDGEKKPDEKTPEKETEKPTGNGHAEPEAAAPVTAEIVNLEVARLAKLEDVAYELERKAAAKKLNIRPTMLDDFVASVANLKKPMGKGRPIEFTAPEPWPFTVDGAALLHEIAKAVRKFVVLSPEAAETVALWIIHTYVFETFFCTPRLGITAPQKQCGKTTLVDVLEHLVARPMMTTSITAAAVFRTVEAVRPTLLIDEADTFLRENDELRGVLNSGHKKGGSVVRTVGDDFEPRQFSTHSPCAIAMIGALPDTLGDRSIKIELRRRLPTEQISNFRPDRIEALRDLVRKAVRWTADKAGQLAVADPQLPPSLHNREADNWRPLFAIAAVAGGDWPAIVERAASRLTGAADGSLKALLLADIREVFEAQDAATGTACQSIGSAALVMALNNLATKPWCECTHGRPLTQHGLAWRLKQYGLEPKKVSTEEGRLNGYARADFDEKCGAYIQQNIEDPPEGGFELDT
jgi:hypothetical protein